MGRIPRFPVGFEGEARQGTSQPLGQRFYCHSGSGLAGKSKDASIVIPSSHQRNLREARRSDKHSALFPNTTLSHAGLSPCDVGSPPSCCSPKSSIVACLKDRPMRKTVAFFAVVCLLPGKGIPRQKPTDTDKHSPGNTPRHSLAPTCCPAELMCALAFLPTQAAHPASPRLMQTRQPRSDAVRKIWASPVLGSSQLSPPTSR